MALPPSIVSSLTPEDSFDYPGSSVLGSPGRRSVDGDTTAGSINLVHLEQNAGRSGAATLQQYNSTIEVPDSVPKREYYTSLRRFGTVGRQGSISGGSMLGGGGGTNTLGPVTAVGSPYPSATMGRTATFGRSNTSASNFKPSGKSVDCAVIMLDGLQQMFSIDKAAYGQQLFDAVCANLDLLETDFFGIKYLAPDNTMCWLKMDKKVAKQVGKNWLFEFQVKFFPYDIDSIVEDLTRYFLCLQVRQNLLSGQLPCSFFSYVILGSYVVQSDAGDFDPKRHQGIAYIRDHPFAPSHLQSTEMLYRIAETHRLHHGQSPEMADRNFLNNSKKLALYGVHMHKVLSSSGVEHGLGVYYGGLLLYLSRIRLQRFSWPRIIKLSYRKRHFIMIVRSLDEDQSERTYAFRCATPQRAKRLWTLCVEHHNFFRLRSYEHSRKPSVLPGFSSRKFTYNQPGMANSLGDLTGSEAVPSHRPQPAIRRMQPQRKRISSTDQTWFTLPHGVNPSTYAVDAFQYQYAPQIASDASLGGDGVGYSFEHWGGGEAACEMPAGAAYRRGLDGSNHLGNYQPRPIFKPEPWRISTADRSRCLGIDDRGLDIASQRDSGWQGCRANKGVKAPGCYYFEATVLEDGPVGVGWATNEAGLTSLGCDDQAFVLGNIEGGQGAATLTFKGKQVDVSDGRIAVGKGTVIGCCLDLDRGIATWNCNGNECPQVLRIPENLINEPFFPAASMKDSRLLLNFGGSTSPPLRFIPTSSGGGGGGFVPLADVVEDAQVTNENCGWRLNPYDATAGVEVRPDGMAVQAHWGSGWQGCRANRGVRGEGRFYYEARVIESNGLARIGWTTEDGSLLVGTDSFGFGYGSDCEGFGLSGQQGKRMHNNEIDNYGESFGEDDVIGCFLDLTQRTVRWAKNGHPFGDAYRLPDDFATAFAANGSPVARRVAFFPTVALNNSTVELNFGDSQFSYFPGDLNGPKEPDWTPLSYIAPENLQVTSRPGPMYKRRGWSYIEPQVGISEAKTVMKPSVDRREDDLSPTAHVAPRLHLAGAVPVMPGLTSVLSPPPKRVAPKTPSMGNGYHTNGDHTELADAIDGIQLSPSRRQHPIPLNSGVGETVTVQRSEPKIESELIEDENGKIIKRTTKRTQVVTTKTYSERFIQPESFIAIPNENDHELDQAILKVTQLDPRVFVRTTNLHHSAPQVPGKRSTSNGRSAHFSSTDGGSAISNSTLTH
ncbi:Band 4.1-like protein 2 [Echinococcus granulosus]|nr:Band 4.1-like protein 2 [Echinococcus granulosus]